MSDTPQDSGDAAGGSPPPEWLISLVRWVGEDPWDFVAKLMLFLSPFFLISAFLAYKLSHMIESKEIKKKQTAKRQKNLKKLRRSKMD